MRNRAKCKLCQSIIESFHRHDYVTCKCGEISVDGGNEYFKCRFSSPENFLRVDDEGNEVIITFREKEEIDISKDVVKKPNKEDLINMLEEMIISFEKLPPHALYTTLTQYDLYSALLLISSIVKAKD